MKTKSIILILLVSSNILFGQQNKWPFKEFAYAKAYMYNLESNLNANYRIIQDGIINSTVTSDGIKLTNVQTAKIISLIDSDINGLIEGLSKTFIPHHAIVFFDIKDNPLSAIVFSFDGEAVRLQPEKKGNKITKELSEKEIAEQLKKLKEFRAVIEELGFQVLNSPFEYQKLKPMQTRSLETTVFKLKGKNKIKQYVSADEKRFDLSGMIKRNDSIFVIADKAWNNHIYLVDTSLNNFNVTSFQQISYTGELDLEGIEYFNGKFYLIDEMSNEVFILEQGKSDLVKLEIPWQNIGIGHSDWGNAGFEGIAIDKEDHVLYLAKEREERYIYRIELKTMEITEPFAQLLKSTGGHDISDLKFENGNLYLLERGLGRITRINCQTKEKLSYSFQDLEYKEGQRMFTNKNPQYGMAEALLLTPDEIWIGYDNNGDPVSEYGKSIGLKDGNQTAIFIFKRPKGF